jgi:hypothetical protein
MFSDHKTYKLFTKNEIYRVNGPYEHMTDYKEEKKSFIGPDGKVKTPPSNILVGLHAKELNRSYPHLNDEYERIRELKRVRFISFLISFCYLVILERKRRT